MLKADVSLAVSLVVVTGRLLHSPLHEPLHDSPQQQFLLSFPFSPSSLSPFLLLFPLLGQAC